MKKTLYLIWNDGTKETVYTERWLIRDGVLAIEISRWEWRRIPLTSIREWQEYF